MNLFVLGWNLPGELFPRALTELRRMVEIYPELDPKTIWHSDAGNLAFAASMHTSVEAAGPRCYVWRNADQVTFYEGCVVDRTGGFAANNAAMLAAHWDQLPDVLEGQFVVIRMASNPPCIELLTDFLGMEQVYYLRQGKMWLISNSVRLLAQICKTSALDPLGVSLCLTVGWVGSDRTLQRDIRVIPGGQHWTWRRDDIEPSQEVYYPVSRLAHQRQRAPTQTDIQQLAEELVTTCRNLAQSYNELYCPLTSGRDTRLLASLLMNGGIKALYYTGGDLDSADVRIGTQIARTFNLPHQVILRTAKDIIEEWDAAASHRLIQQNDGMVSLRYIAGAAYSPQPSSLNRLRLSLGGVGGEIGRGYYFLPKIYLYGYSTQRMQDYLVKNHVNDYGGLIRRDATALAQTYIRRFVEEVVDQGFPPLDAANLFYAFERVRRWAGGLARKARPRSDVFSPLCTRPFVEAAFAMPLLYRVSEPLHYALIRLLVPELHGLPLGKAAWRSQRPRVNLGRLAVEKHIIPRIPNGIRNRMFRQHSRKLKPESGLDRRVWLEAKRSWLRELCLDQSASPLWDFVDRPLFERIMSNDTDVAERRGRHDALYNIATLFHYTLEFISIKPLDTFNIYHEA
jgi:asparagine synthase (glutamine-hydrolysing)